MIRSIFAAAACCILALGCSAVMETPAKVAEKGLEYCARQTMRTLDQIEAAGYGMSPRNIAPGDSLLLYTDGVTEAMNSAGEFFGSSRLLEICSDSSTDDSPEALLVRIGDSMTAFTAGTPQSDDITLLAVTFR